MEGEKKRRSLDIDLSINPKLIAIFVLVVLTISMIETGGFSSLNIGNAGSGSTAPTFAIAPDRGNTYSGMLDVSVNHRDVLDMSETREEGEDLVTTFYKKTSSGKYVVLGSGDDATIFIDDRDRKLYFTVEPKSGVNLFVSPMGTINGDLNPRIIDFEFLDVNHDGIKEWIFTFDVTSLNTMGGITAPSLALFTMTYDEGNLALNSPQDFKIYPDNSINNIQWELHVPEETGVPIKRVRLILDTTDSTLIKESGSWISIPYIDNIELQEMDVSRTTSETIYEYDFGDDLSYADYVHTERNANPIHDMTVRLHTHLEDGDDLKVTLEVTSMTASQAYDKIEDSVKLTANYDQEVKTMDVVYETNNCSIKNFRMAQTPFQIKVFHDPTSNSVLNANLQDQDTAYQVDRRENRMQFHTDSADNFEIYYEINYNEPQLRELIIEYISDGIVLQRSDERFNEAKHCIVFYLETENRIPTREDVLGLAGQQALDNLKKLSGNIEKLTWTPSLNCSAEGECAMNYTYEISINSSQNYYINGTSWNTSWSP